MNFSNLELNNPGEFIVIIDDKKISVSSDGFLAVAQQGMKYDKDQEDGIAFSLATAAYLEADKRFGTDWADNWMEGYYDSTLESKPSRIDYWKMIIKEWRLRAV
tara:strand:- start:269 stop:580 length:312 start_codon:yes stop_codon:yes gene_type:complete